ncbi:MAG: cytochrome P450 [Acidimicrobiales bacterium]|nr:cytochrome P450 [Acidimicrobiales bacterium]
MTDLIQRPETPAFDTAAGRFYDDPWGAYRWMRDNDPCYWDEANGYWVISRHEDVTMVSRNTERYCSKFGVRPKVSVPMSIISMDEPEHTRQRRLINKGFTPRQVKRLEPHIRELSNQIIDEIQARGEIDFVEDFAIHVPLIVIAELMGLDPEGRRQLYRWSDAMMAGDGHTDPEDPALLEAAQAFGEYVEYLIPIIEEKRQQPREDLISILVGAYDEGALDGGDSVAIAKDGDQLTSDDLLMFLCVVIVAGNETTRNAITGGLKAFSDFPDQKAKLLAHPELIDLAVDEIVRYVSPVISFTRTVTEDHVLHGKELKEGDKVLLLYQSANRDERVFDAPDEFRVDRDPNPHIGFGIGPHYCLGANLAKLEVKVVFEELFRRLADIRVADGASLSRADNALVLAIERLPAVFTPHHGS